MVIAKPMPLAAPVTITALFEAIYVPLALASAPLCDVYRAGVRQGRPLPHAVVDVWGHHRAQYGVANQGPSGDGSISSLVMQENAAMSRPRALDGIRVVDFS